MAPADDKDSQVILGEGTEGKSLPTPPGNQPIGTLPLNPPHHVGDKPWLSSQTGIGNQEHFGENSSFHAIGPSAKDRFSRHIQAITDQAAARRQRSATGQPQEPPPQLEEGEITAEVSTQPSTFDLGSVENFNLTLSQRYELRSRSRSAGPSTGPRERRLGRAGSTSRKHGHTRGRARIEVSKSHPHPNINKPPDPLPLQALSPIIHTAFIDLGVDTNPSESPDLHLRLSTSIQPKAEGHGSHTPQGDTNSSLHTSPDPDLHQDSSEDSDIVEEDFFTGEEDDYNPHEPPHPSQHHCESFTGNSGHGTNHHDTPHPPINSIDTQVGGADAGSKGITPSPSDYQENPSLDHFDTEVPTDHCVNEDNPTNDAHDNRSHDEIDEIDDILTDGQCHRNHDETDDTKAHLLLSQNHILDIANETVNKTDVFTRNRIDVYPSHYQPNFDRYPGRYLYSQPDPAPLGVNIEQRPTSNLYQYQTDLAPGTPHPYKGTSLIHHPKISPRTGESVPIYTLDRNRVSTSSPVQTIIHEEKEQGTHHRYTPWENGPYTGRGIVQHTYPDTVPHYLGPTPSRFFLSSSPGTSYRDFPGDISPIIPSCRAQREFHYGPPNEEDTEASHSLPPSSLESTHSNPDHSIDIDHVYHSPKFDTILSKAFRMDHTEGRPTGAASPSLPLLRNPTSQGEGNIQTLTHTLQAPIFHTVEVQTDPYPSGTAAGTQTDPITFPCRESEDQEVTNQDFTTQLSRCPLFPQGENRHPIPDTNLVQITVPLGTNCRYVSLFQTEDEDSIMTTKSVDALVDQVRTLMVDSSRFAVRAEHMRLMNQANILAPWATAVQPYPPFVQCNHKLLARIREIRIEATNKIQSLAELEFERQSLKLNKEGETLIGTLEAMMKGKNTPLLNERLTQTASHVGKTKAQLQEKMENRREFLAKRQPTHPDWDDYFHYAIAYRRNQDTKSQAFEITTADRAQADLEMEREIAAVVKEDFSDEEPTRPQHNKRRKRDTATNQRQPEPYRIPKKPNNRPGRRDRRDDTPQRNNRDDRDFGKSRPSQERRPAAVYYNSNNHNRLGNRDGRDESPAERKDRRGQNRKDWDSDRDRRLIELQRELDSLRRN